METPTTRFNLVTKYVCNYKIIGEKKLTWSRFTTYMPIQKNELKGRTKFGADLLFVIPRKAEVSLQKKATEK